MKDFHSLFFVLVLAAVFCSVLKCSALKSKFVSWVQISVLMSAFMCPFFSSVFLFLLLWWFWGSSFLCAHSSTPTRLSAPVCSWTQVSLLKWPTPVGKVREWGVLLTRRHFLVVLPDVWVVCPRILCLVQGNCCGLVFQGCGYKWFQTSKLSDKPHVIWVWCLSL